MVLLHAGVSSSLERVAHTFSVSELLSCDVYSNTVRSRGNILTRCLVRASFKEAWEGYSVGGGYPMRPCGTRNLNEYLSNMSVGLMCLHYFKRTIYEQLA